jgi:hypothetical protein
MVYRWIYADFDWPVLICCDKIDQIVFQTRWRLNVISSSNDLLELKMIFTQDEAGKRYCPISMSNPEGIRTCEASGCHAWRWLPDQHDARTAVGFCGMAPVSQKGSQLHFYLLDQ